MIKAVIFDLDGVIINSEPLHDESTAIVLQKNGISISEKERKQFLGLNDKEIFSQVVKENKLKKTPEDLIQEREKVYFDLIKKVKENKLKKTPEDLIQEREKVYFDLIKKKGLDLFPGVLEAIQKFSKRYKLAITTSSEKSKVDFTLKKFNLSQYFPIIITGEDITKGKPDPEPYIKTIKQLGVKSKECLVIEDSINGMKSALDAGCFCIAVTNTFPAAQLKQADMIVQNISEINENVITLVGM